MSLGKNMIMVTSYQNELFVLENIGIVLVGVIVRVLFHYASEILNSEMGYLPLNVYLNRYLRTIQ